MGSIGSPEIFRRSSDDNLQNNSSAAVLPKCCQSASRLMIRASAVRAHLFVCLLEIRATWNGIFAVP